MRGKEFLFLLIPFLLFIACDRIDSDPSGDELARFNAWIDVHNIEAIADTITPDGLYFINKQEGTGLAPTDSSYLIYTCTVRNLDDHMYITTSKDTADLYGTFSYSTHYTPVYSLYISKSFSPVGLKEGLKMMKEGGKAQLIMRSNLAYGKNGSGAVPSYESLIYDVELIKVVTDPEAYEQSLIQNYLANNLGFVNYSDTAYIKVIEDEATTTHYPVNNDTVSVFYTGRFLDNYVFDTNIDTVAINNHIYTSSSNSSNNPYKVLTFKLGAGKLTAGFQFAIRHMNEGARIRAIIPSTYEYGVAGSDSKIPPYTPLIFDIYLYKIGKISK